MQLGQPWEANSTYRATFLPRTQPPVDDEFERIVASKLNRPVGESQTSPSKLSTDPYELIVQRKMEEPHPAGEPEAPPDATSDDWSPPPRASKDDAPPPEGASDYEGPTERRRGPQKRHKGAKAAHLGRTARPRRPTAKVGGQVPRFFRHPEHASQEEKKHLYGPFFVVWPKNKRLPSSYAELAQIYGRT
jgi:hypothetical protein